MKKISTYIFVHDQQIILDADASQKFNVLPEPKYVFLGNKPVDKIISRTDVIIARDLPCNMEQYPKFCSFTGWYVLWKNNLIKSEYVHLFEYDIDIHPEFKQTVESLLQQQPDFIGYVPKFFDFFYIHPPEYLAGIDKSIKINYDIDIIEFIDTLRKQKKGQQWSTTSNSTFSLKTFSEYMIWFEKLIDDLKDNTMSGHAHERSISFFYLLHNKKVFLTKDLIKHFILNGQSYANIAQN